jgi:hypothetical protein
MPTGTMQPQPGIQGAQGHTGQKEPEVRASGGTQSRTDPKSGQNPAAQPQGLRGTAQVTRPTTPNIQGVPTQVQTSQGSQGVDEEMED